jgi:hypothetical protein
MMQILIFVYDHLANFNIRFRTISMRMVGVVRRGFGVRVGENNRHVR